MKFKKKTLKNGLRIIVAPMKGSLTTTVLVLTETGSKYETKRINGISHFLEHMCFKGTIKRPTSRAISEELDGMGASYNAFTGHEYTGYYAKVDGKHFEQALDVVSDIYLHSALPAKEIEKERGVIIGEIEMYEDTPRRQVVDLFTDLLYGDQPAGWNIAGTRGVIRKLTRRDFISYRKSHYVAKATTVVVAGKVQEKQVFKEVEKAFKEVSRSQKIGKKKVAERQARPAILLKYKKTSQSHLILGFRAHDVYNKHKTALNVLASLLGGGMSSRLFHRIRDEMGAGYYVGADADFFTDHGFFSTFVGVDNTRVLEITEALLEEIRRVYVEKVSLEELTKVKNFMIGNLFSGLEKSDEIASLFGSAAVLKCPLKTPDMIADEIEKITAEELQDVARDIFQNKKMNFALIGPFKDKAQLKKILTL